MMFIFSILNHYKVFDEKFQNRIFIISTFDTKISSLCKKCADMCRLQGCEKCDSIVL